MGGAFLRIGSSFLTIGNGPQRYLVIGPTPLNTDDEPYDPSLPDGGAGGGARTLIAVTAIYGDVDTGKTNWTGTIAPDHLYLVFFNLNSVDGSIVLSGAVNVTLIANFGGGSGHCVAYFYGDGVIDVDSAQNGLDLEFLSQPNSGFVVETDSDFGNIPDLSLNFSGDIVGSPPADPADGEGVFIVGQTFDFGAVIAINLFTLAEVSVNFPPLGFLQGYVAGNQGSENSPWGWTDNPSTGYIAGIRLTPITETI